MEKEQWQQIYDDSDPGFKASISQEKFNDLFGAISRKIGKPLNCKLTGWNINATTSGTYLSTVCETKFDKDATGTESIVWRKDGAEYRLYGYHINSQELITR